MRNVTLVYFWAEWCAPCRLLKPIVVDLSKDYNVTLLNADENTELVKEYSIKAIPTLIFEVNDEEVERLIGFTSREQLVKKFEEHLNGD
jgi:thioredoxin 1